MKRSQMKKHERKVTTKMKEAKTKNNKETRKEKCDGNKPMTENKTEEVMINNELKMKTE